MVYKVGGLIKSAILYGMALLLVGTFSVNPANAQKRKRSSGQWAIVAEVGVTVYSQPSFDAPVMAYFEKGQKVRISRKIYPGIGGLGAFYKVIVSKGKVGYVTDIDVVPEYETRTGSTGRLAPTQQKNEEFNYAKKPERNLEPIFFTRYMGVSVGQIDYAEKVLGKVMQEPTTAYGLKLTGPNVLSDSAIIDFDFYLSVGVPAYYKKFADKATGFFVLTNISLPAPLIETKNGLFYWSLGLSFIYTNFDLTVGSARFDSQEIRMGATGAGGYAHRLFDDWLIKAEGRYTYEKTQYSSLWLAVQRYY